MKELHYIMLVKKTMKKWLTYYLKNGANVNAIDSKEKSPLHLACKYSNNENLINLLLQHNADVAKEDTGSNTPLHIACEHTNNEKIVELLIKHSADVNAINYPDVSTPLHIACGESSNEKIVELLLSNDADTEGTDFWGYTPLLIACEHTKNSKIVELLLNYNADVTINLFNLTPFKAAHKNEHCQNEIMNLLLKMKGENGFYLDQVSYAYLPSYIEFHPSLIHHLSHTNQSLLHRVINGDFNYDYFHDPNLLSSAY